MRSVNFTHNKDIYKYKRRDVVGETFSRSADTGVRAGNEFWDQGIVDPDDIVYL